MIKWILFIYFTPIRRTSAVAVAVVSKLQLRFDNTAVC